MSYDNAYVPLDSGLNIICGPNGAGKSSILLAIAIVLGQAYTERSRRLSDLIRWGEDQARITLTLDNTPRNGGRPFPQHPRDTVTVTRVLRKNGEYSYLLQEKPISKSTIADSFKKTGLNPDNMLIIMHQLMVGRFASISPQEKLEMIEEAVGFQSYRTDVLDAYSRLRRIESEEEGLAATLESTKETYDYWKREYEKYQKKKKLELTLQELQAELLWAKIEKREAAVAKLRSRMDSRRKAVESTKKKIVQAEEFLQKHQTKFDELRSKVHDLESSRVKLAREESAAKVNLSWTEKILEENRLEVADLTNRIVELNSLSHTDNASPKELVKAKELLEEHKAKLQSAESENVDLIATYQKEVKALEDRFAKTELSIKDVNSGVEKALSKLIEFKVEVEVLAFKKSLLEEELGNLEVEIKLAEEELTPLLVQAQKFGSRMTTVRKILDIMSEIGFIEEQLKPLAHLSEDVEKMYTSYSNMFDDLRRKAEDVTKNREEILAELNKRLDRWRETMEQFLEDINLRFNSILDSVSAKGMVRLTNIKNIEKAGVELLVGFKGAKPTPLDAFTQSGGERSVALMAFLLALQQHITSPFRAIDEFDVHMDPRNRETVTNLIVSSAKKAEGGQYIAITPGQITVPDEGMHILVVQNISGTSTISEVKLGEATS